MPIINVTHLSKDFQVYKHHRGLTGAFRNLFTREFRMVNAVSEVSFSIERGELVGYIGPNGAGKSTTMRVILGLDAAEDGTAVRGVDYYANRGTIVFGPGVMTSTLSGFVAGKIAALQLRSKRVLTKQETVRAAATALPVG